MFVDWKDAGRRLGLVLRRDLGAERTDVVVIGLSRGGMVVASEIARMLGASLDVLAVRELCVPGRPGAAFGAIGEGGGRVLNKGQADSLGLGEAEVRAVEMTERIEVERQAHRFRGERPRIPLAGATAVIVDDGIGGACTTRAACAVARAEGATRVVLAMSAVPAGRESLLAGAADALVALEASGPFDRSHESTWEVTDEEVATLLDGPGEAAGVLIDEDVDVDLGPVRLTGHLSVGDRCAGVVVFAHGDSSSRHSPRNVFVAGELRRAGLGTFLLDLLTGAEERDLRKVFDVEMLAERLLGVTTWLRRRPEVAEARIGYLGAGTGAAAALWAASDLSVPVHAVVSRGGRPDLAEPRLHEVEAPTLLIVGGEDRRAVQLNRRAAALMRCPTRVWVVPGASGRSTEPGALEAAAELARVWFGTHLGGDPSTGRG